MTLTECATCGGRGGQRMYAAPATPRVFRSAPGTGQLGILNAARGAGLSNLTLGQLAAAMRLPPPGPAAPVRLDQIAALIDRGRLAAQMARPALAVAAAQMRPAVMQAAMQSRPALEQAAQIVQPAVQDILNTLGPSPLAPPPAPLAFPVCAANGAGGAGSGCLVRELGALDDAANEHPGEARVPNGTPLEILGEADGTITVQGAPVGPRRWSHVRFRGADGSIVEGWMLPENVRAGGAGTGTGQFISRSRPNAVNTGQFLRRFLDAGTIAAAWTNPSALERVIGALQQVDAGLGRAVDAQQIRVELRDVTNNIQARIAQLRGVPSTGQIRRIGRVPTGPVAPLEGTQESAVLSPQAWASVAASRLETALNAARRGQSDRIVTYLHTSYAEAARQAQQVPIPLQQLYAAARAPAQTRHYQSATERQVRNLFDFNQIRASIAVQTVPIHTGPDASSPTQGYTDPNSWLIHISQETPGGWTQVVSDAGVHGWVQTTAHGAPTMAGPYRVDSHHTQGGQAGPSQVEQEIGNIVCEVAPDMCEHLIARYEAEDGQGDRPTTGRQVFRVTPRVGQLALYSAAVVNTPVAEGVNLRAAPSLKAPILAGLPNGTPISPQADAADQDTGAQAWAQVYVPSLDTSGYILFVNPDGNWNVTANA